MIFRRNTSFLLSLPMEIDDGNENISSHSRNRIMIEALRWCFLIVVAQLFGFQYQSCLTVSSGERPQPYPNNWFSANSVSFSSCIPSTWVWPLVFINHVMKECPLCHPHPLTCNAFSAVSHLKCGLSQLCQHPSAYWIRIQERRWTQGRCRNTHTHRKHSSCRCKIAKWVTLLSV